ncbi:MAG: Hsp70 family protein [Pirellulales bacterium]|nr:Hsp70 family protein [Pirellulales bacterium]
MVDSATGNLVGIDLGTTFSVIAQFQQDGSARTIANLDGEPLTPSAVYLDLSTNTALVGRAACEAATAEADKVAMFVKRDMGKPFYSQLVCGRRMRPETLSAIILRKLKQDAEKRIGPTHRAVITVPAFFDDTRRKATQDAGRIAGLDVIDIINEPTAAALAYALVDRQPATDQGVLDLPGGTLTALVYDLGGGTFDVTVVRLHSRRFETLATDGAVKLGGKDWDDKIVEYVAREFQRQHGLNPLDDPQRRVAIHVEAEKKKRLLSKLPKVPIECFHAGRSLKLELTRSQFEELSRDLLAQTQMVTQLVVQQAKLGWHQIDRVLLVGGSTRMPMVKEMLRQATGKVPDDSLDADQVVARGAALHAGILAAREGEGELELEEEARDKLRDVEVLNVNAYSLGVEAARGDRMVNAILINKNTQLPYAASRIFRIRHAGATSVRVKVLEGEAPSAEDNILIGECQITGLPPNLPAKSPVQVRLSYSENGRISVMALDMTAGRLAQAEIRREHGMTDEDIRRECAFVQNLRIE